MSKYELTFRRTKGSPVTSDEIDQNFRNIKIGHDDHEKRVSALEKINVDFATDEELLFQVQRLDSKIDNIDIPEPVSPYTDTDVQNYLTENNYVDEDYLSANFGTFTAEQQTKAFSNRFAAKTTTDLEEGDNLYFTEERARSAILVDGDLSYDSSTGVVSYVGPTDFYTQSETDAKISERITEVAAGNITLTGYATETYADATINSKTTDDLVEGTTNLYFTEERAQASLESTTTSLNNAITSIQSDITKIYGELTGQKQLPNYDLTSENTVVAGSSANADDVIVISSNAFPNDKFRLVVKYVLSTGLISTVLDEVRTFDYNLSNLYNLNIPWDRRYTGSKIDSITIEVYDDPDIQDTRTEAQLTTSITVEDAPISFTVTTTKQLFEEGETTTVTVNTTNIENNTVLTYSLSGIDESDVATSLTGDITINTNTGDGLGSGSFDIEISEDSITEGNETVTVTVELGSVSETLTFEIDDTSRAREVWTLRRWVEETSENSGLTVTDYDAAISTFETFRSNMLNLATPSDLSMNSQEVLIKLIRKSWVDSATLVLLDTTDMTYLSQANTYITEYNENIASLGFTTTPILSDLILRPSTSTNREDDIAYTFVINNINTVLTPELEIYNEVEEKPV